MKRGGWLAGVGGVKPRGLKPRGLKPRIAAIWRSSRSRWPRARTQAQTQARTRDGSGWWACTIAAWAIALAAGERASPGHAYSVDGGQLADRSDVRAADDTDDRTDPWALLAPLPAGVSFAAAFDAPAGRALLDEAAPLLSAIEASGLFNRTLEAWRDSARELGMSPEELALAMFSGRVVLAQAQGQFGDREAPWVVVTEVGPQTEARLRRGLRPAPRDVVNGVHLLSIESGRNTVAFPGGGMPGGGEAAQGARVVLIAPSGADGLLRALLEPRAGGARLGDEPGFAAMRAGGGGAGGGGGPGWMAAVYRGGLGLVQGAAPGAGGSLRGFSVEGAGRSYRASMCVVEPGWGVGEGPGAWAQEPWLSEGVFEGVGSGTWFSAFAGRGTWRPGGVGGVDGGAGGLSLASLLALAMKLVGGAALEALGPGEAAAVVIRPEMPGGAVGPLTITAASLSGPGPSIDRRATELAVRIGAGGVEPVGAGEMFGGAVRRARIGVSRAPSEPWGLGWEGSVAAELGWFASACPVEGGGGGGGDREGDGGAWSWGAIELAPVGREGPRLELRTLSRLLCANLGGLVGGGLVGGGLVGGGLVGGGWGGDGPMPEAAEVKRAAGAAGRAGEFGGAIVAGLEMRPRLLLDASAGSEQAGSEQPGSSTAGSGAGAADSGGIFGLAGVIERVGVRIGPAGPWIGAEDGGPAIGIRRGWIEVELSPAGLAGR